MLNNKNFVRRFWAPYPKAILIRHVTHRWTGKPAGRNHYVSKKRRVEGADTAPTEKIRTCH